MALHLLKLCVGVDQVDQLQGYQAARLARGERLVHVTRHRPKRAEEVLDGGSLYWVIKRRIAVRQRIVGLEPVEGEDGVRRCAIILHPDLVRTVPHPRRPHQGWRYFVEEDAPADLPAGESGADFPATLVSDLRDLGLI